jgi:hypothetical protein
MPRTFNDVPLQITFSERSPRVGARIVDSVENSIDIKERNADSVDFDGLPGSRRNVFDVCDGDKLRHCVDPSLGRLADGTGSGRRPVSDLISNKAYGIEIGTYSNTTPRPSHTRSLGWE